MRGQQAVGVAVALVDDATDFHINQLGGCLAVGLMLERRREAGVLWIDKADRAERLAHPPAQDHVTRDICDLLEIVLGTAGYRVKDQPLCRASTERTGDARTQVVFSVAGA